MQTRSELIVYNGDDYDHNDHTLISVTMMACKEIMHGFEENRN